jgi:hypothetical protein
MTDPWSGVETKYDQSRLNLNGRCTSNWTDSTKHFQLNWFHQICPRQLDWTSNFFRSALCLWRSSQDFFNKAFPWNKTEIGKHKSQITEMFLYCALSALGFTLKTLKATWLIIPSLYWRVRAGRDGWDMLHWMPKSSNISTGESRPEVTSGTASAFTASFDCWSSARSSSSSRPIASSNAQTVKLDARHGQDMAWAHSLQINYILTYLNIVWLSSASDVFQTGGVPDFTRWKKKAEIAKYNFVAVRGTETKPCPGPLVLKLGANQATLYFKPCHRNKRKLWANLEHD